MLVSIIVPAYKQEKTIRKNIESIFEVMGQTRWDFEIIVVVDGFIDDTFKEASKFSSPKVKVMGYEHNKGKGYAVRYGMARAVGEFISFIDAGMDIDASGISMILEHMLWYDADIVVGSKKHPASRVNYPFMRKIYSFGYHTLVRLFFGLKVTDTQTGLKVYKRKVLEDVLPRLLIKRFAFDIEILAVANRLGYNKIYEAPVKVNFDFSNTNFDRFLFLDKNIQAILVDTLAVFYRLYILKYYDSDHKRKWEYDEELKMRVNTGGMLNA